KGVKRVYLRRPGFSKSNSPRRLIERKNQYSELAQCVIWCASNLQVTISGFGREEQSNIPTRSKIILVPQRPADVLKWDMGKTMGVIWKKKIQIPKEGRSQKLKQAISTDNLALQEIFRRMSNLKLD
ncbi:hypothetical protein J6590_098711, partial [Homalodisca vitripennis]